MGAGPGLARRLRAALRAEEPRAVEELLRRGADPNLVLAGAAPVHLAAGVRGPRGLRCLGALLRAGGDPNARSAEALTPLHVAAAWGCRRGLELLLSRGADPGLRDQDGLRARDLAALQGHADCERLLRARDPPSPGAPQEPLPQPAEQLSHGPPGSAAGTPDSRGEAAPGPPSLPAPHDGPPGLWDSSCDATFLTAPEDPYPGPSPRAQAGQGSPPAAPRAQRVPGSPGTHRPASLGGEAELNAHLQALTLAPPGPARSPPRAPSPGPPDCHAPADEEPAAPWVTEGRVGGPSPPCRPPPAPAVSDLELLRRLRALGEDPGPVTAFTRRHYLRRLQEAGAAPGPDFSGHSPELAEALQTGRIPDAQGDEDALARQFERPDPARRWRGGVVKSSFTYLLLDPRVSQDLPARAGRLTPAQRLQTFVRSVFYVGKGSRARPDAHLREALGRRGQPGTPACPKVRRILDIWASGRGVVSLHCFQHVVAAEAYTREACLVEALGVQTLTNQRQGHCYGAAGGWPPARRRRLGVHLLHRALLVFLAEGERELRPQDVQARG